MDKKMFVLKIWTNPEKTEYVIQGVCAECKINLIAAGEAEIYVPVPPV